MASCAEINIKVGDSPRSCRSCHKTQGNNRPGVKYCLDCYAWFCSDCLRPHGIFCEAHTLSDRGSSSTPSSIPCVVHKDTAVMYFCVSCKHCICPLCRTDDGAHKAHPCISLTDRIKEVKAEVQTALVSLKSNEKTAEEKIAKLNIEFSAVSARVLEAGRQVQKQVETLRDEHQKLKDELEQQLLGKKKSFTKEIKKLQKYLIDADVALDVTEISSLSDKVHSEVPEVPDFLGGLHEACVPLLFGEDLSDEQTSDVLKSLKPVTSTPSGLHEAGRQIMLGEDLTEQQSTDLLKAVMDKKSSPEAIVAALIKSAEDMEINYKIRLLRALKSDHVEISSALRLWNINPRDLSGEQTAQLIQKGSRVIRGRDWKWGNLDGNGLGTVRGQIRSTKWVKVLWDSGVSRKHRMGHQNAYDLALADH